MNPSIKTIINTWTRSSLGTAIVGLGLITWTGANAADLVCQGTLFGDTDFAAYYGDENGFGRIELQHQRGGSVEVPLQYMRRNNQGEAVFRGNNPDQTSDVVEVFAPTPVRSETRIRVTYNGNPAPGNCSGTGESPPPSSSTPTEECLMRELLPSLVVPMPQAVRLDLPE